MPPTDGLGLRVFESRSNMSLIDAGYTFANLDDGWQACHAGVNNTFHSKDGTPLPNLTTFPDIHRMTAAAHKQGLTPGFYVNNYICAEGMPPGTLLM